MAYPPEPHATKEEMYELDMKGLVADAVVEALDTIDERRSQQEEASRYERMELARWAMEVACRTNSAQPNITSVSNFADQLITYVETKGQ